MMMKRLLPYTVVDYGITFFPFHGWFEGTISSTNPKAMKNTCVHVFYLDGDVEDMPE